MDTIYPQPPTTRISHEDAIESPPKVSGSIEISHRYHSSNPKKNRGETTPNRGTKGEDLDSDGFDRLNLVPLDSVAVFLNEGFEERRSRRWILYRLRFRYDEGFEFTSFIKRVQGTVAAEDRVGASSHGDSPHCRSHRTRFPFEPFQNVHTRRGRPQGIDPNLAPPRQHTPLGSLRSELSLLSSGFDQRDRTRRIEGGSRGERSKGTPFSRELFFLFVFFFWIFILSLSRAPTAWKSTASKERIASGLLRKRNLAWERWYRFMAYMEIFGKDTCTLWIRNSVTWPCWR